MAKKKAGKSGQRRKTAKFSDQIRAAAADSGLSQYRLCRMIDIGESTMSRFMGGHVGLSMAVLDRLAEVLGLRVVVDEKAKARKE